jgi:hypothetical protein
MSPEKNHGEYTCVPRQLTVCSDNISGIVWGASDKITGTIRADSHNWRWALTWPVRYHQKPLTRSWWLYVRSLTTDCGLWQDQGDNMRSLWQDHSDYTCGLWQLTMGSDRTMATAGAASDEITVTTLTTNHEFCPDCEIAQVASAKGYILQI